MVNSSFSNVIMEKRDEKLPTKDDELQLHVLKNKYSSDSDYNLSATSNTLDEIPAVENLQNALPLTNSFSDIDLSTCSNVQIGTRIITSNLTVIDQNENTFGGLKGVEKFIPASENILRENDIYCHIACKSCFKRLWLKIVFIIILAFVLSLALIETFIINIPNNNNEEIISTTSVHITKRFVMRQEWGTPTARHCHQNLTKTNQIKIISTHKACDSFSVCRKTLLDWQNGTINRKYDLFFHFGISEDGIIYEGLSTQCETRPAYRNCNDSFLIVVIFYGSNICLDTDEIQTQVQSFNRLVKYNEDNGVLSNDSLVIEMTRFCFKYYFPELNKTYANVSQYRKDVEYSC